MVTVFAKMEIQVIQIRLPDVIWEIVEQIALKPSTALPPTREGP